MEQVVLRCRVRVVGSLCCWMNYITSCASDVRIAGTIQLSSDGQLSVSVTIALSIRRLVSALSAFLVLEELLCVFQSSDVAIVQAELILAVCEISMSRLLELILCTRNISCVFIIGNKFHLQKQLHFTKRIDCGDLQFCVGMKRELGVSINL